MYARSTRLEDGRISVPENYDGVAFMEKPIEMETMQERSIKVLGSPSSEAKISPQKLSATETNDERAYSAANAEEMANNSTKGVKDTFLGFFDKLQIPKFLGGFIPITKDAVSLSKIGSEEILIIATAAFLFFSKEGDKECAIMLLLLLLAKK